MCVNDGIFKRQNYTPPLLMFLALVHSNSLSIPPYFATPVKRISTAVYGWRFIRWVLFCEMSPSTVPLNVSRSQAWLVLHHRTVCTLLLTWGPSKQVKLTATFFIPLPSFEFFLSMWKIEVFRFILLENVTYESLHLKVFNKGHNFNHSIFLFFIVTKNTPQKSNIQGVWIIYLWTLCMKMCHLVNTLRPEYTNFFV